MRAPKNPHLRAAVEVGSIIFLFYANLLMGEFTASAGRGKTLGHALADIFTVKTAGIAVATSIAGHFIFQLMREKASV